MKTILTTVILTGALALTACGKDKKPATTEPTAAEPAKTEAKDPAKADTSADKPADQKAPEKTGW